MAAGVWEGQVSIWDVAAGRQLSCFQTVLDPGGRRLALNPEGTLCVAAGFRRGGVAAYRAEDGEQVWGRKDLRRAQYLSMSADGRSVYVTFDERGAEELDVHTGQTRQVLRGVRRVVQGACGSTLLATNTRVELRDASGQRTGWVEGRGPAVLDATFSPEALFISVVGPYVWRIGITDAAVAWEYRSPLGSNIHRLSYCERDAALYAVEYDADRPTAALLRFDPQSGAACVVTSLPMATWFTFLPQLGLLVTSSGDVVHLHDGSLAATLPWAP